MQKFKNQILTSIIIFLTIECYFVLMYHYFCCNYISGR